MEMENIETVRLRDAQVHATDYSRNVPGESQNKLYKSSFRAYRSSPEGATIQLRSFGGISSRSANSKPRVMVSSATYVDKLQIRAIIELLEKVEKELR